MSFASNTRNMEANAVWRRPPKSGPHTPLVVLLHGRGADEYDLLDVSARLPPALAFASLRAPVPLEGGGFTWFENRGAARPIASSLQASVGLVRAWLDSPAVAPASRRCYLFGFSAGMMMAGALLLADPKRFAGAVLLSGAFALDGRSDLARRLAGLPIFYGYGTLDDVIPQPLVMQTKTYLEDESGCELTLRPYPHDHTISTRELSDIADWFQLRL